MAEGGKSHKEKNRRKRYIVFWNKENTQYERESDRMRELQSEIEKVKVETKLK